MAPELIKEVKVRFLFTCSQSYVKLILYKREVLIKLRFIGKIIGFQGGTLREY